MNPQIANLFTAWLDAALQEVPPNVRAFSFNLYEGETTWDIQLSGTTRFDPSDQAWACDPVYSHPKLYVIAQADVGTEWEEILSLAIDLVAAYLKSGSQRQVLRWSQGVGVGFVDGDLTILWPENAFQLST